MNLNHFLSAKKFLKTAHIFSKLKNEANQDKKAKKANQSYVSNWFLSSQL